MRNQKSRKYVTSLFLVVALAAVGAIQSGDVFSSESSGGKMKVVGSVNQDAPTQITTYKTHTGENDGALTVEYRSILFGTKTLERMKSNQDTRDYVNKNFLSKMARIESDVPLYTKNFQVPAGTHYISMTSDGKNWMLDVTSEDGKSVLKNNSDGKSPGPQKLWVADSPLDLQRLMIAVQPMKEPYRVSMKIMYGKNYIPLFFNVGHKFAAGQSTSGTSQ